MKRVPTVLVTLAVLGALVVPMVSRAAAPGEVRVVADDVVSADGRLHHLTVHSPALGRNSELRILLPAGYATSGARYPVLYLLHGAGDDESSWTKNTDIEEATAQLGLIVVMPDGGRSPDAGWYTDWVSGPAWERHHIGELVPFVDEHYRTIATREGRAVAGLSMGGFGAFSYAARHPQLFSAAASFSGLVDNAEVGLPQSLAFKAIHDQYGTPDERVWGEYGTDEVRWRAHNPPDLATNLRWTRLWHRAGNGVPRPGDQPQDIPTEAGVYQMNVKFDLDLDAKGIEHEWVDRGDGTHDWRYWQDDLHQLLPELMAAFAQPRPAPAAFDYRSAEPSFSAWGWDFATDRSVREFVDLTGVSPAGLTVRGSGGLRVTTAGLYQPGGHYEIAGAGGEPIEALADEAGRLTFRVDLGPSHTVQQYAPEATVAEAAAGASYWRTAAVTIRTLSPAAGRAPARPAPAPGGVLPATS